MVNKSILLCGAALVVGLAGTAQAAPNNTQDQVVVTAQKREQRLQDVPVVVTVLNAKQLQDAGVQDVRDLTLLTPGLSATTNGTEASATSVAGSMPNRLRTTISTAAIAMTSAAASSRRCSDSLDSRASRAQASGLQRTTPGAGDAG